MMMNNANMNACNNMNNQNMCNMNNPSMLNNMNNFQNFQNQMMSNNMQNLMNMNNMQMPMHQMANNSINFMNQNNLNNAQFQMNYNPQPIDDNEFLTVKFRDTGIEYDENTDGPSVAIHCKANEKVSDLILRYRTKSGFQDEAKFVFNAKNLVPSLTVAESGIYNNSYVFVVRTGGIKGAYRLHKNLLF